MVLVRSGLESSGDLDNQGDLQTEAVKLMGPLNMAIDHAERKLCPLMRPAGETETPSEIRRPPRFPFRSGSIFRDGNKKRLRRGGKNNCCGELILEDTSWGPA